MSGSSAGAFVRARHAGIGRAFGSTTMAVYVMVLLAVFLTPVLVNVLVVVLQHPLIVSALSTAQPLNWSYTAGLCTLFAIAVGEIRGPIAPGLFEAVVRLQSPQPRWKSLGAIALRSFIAAALTLGIVGLLVGVAGSIALNWPTDIVVRTSLGGLLLGMACANARLLGQTKVAYLTVWCTAILGATSLLAITYDVFSAVVILEVGLLALSAPWLIPFCLGRLRTETVFKHSILAEASSTLTKTGDWSAASREYRLAASTGRRTWVLPRRFAAAIPRTPWGLWFSAWRTPRRASLGVLLVALAALLLGYVISLDRMTDTSQAGLVISGAALAVAFSLIYAGFGAFTEGLEFAAETAGSVAVFRLSAGAMLSRTGAAYILLMLIIGLPLGLILGSLVNGGIGFFSPSLGGATVLGLIQIAMARIHAVTKGPLPPQLTTPIPTPVGDFSVLMILAWQFDAVAYGPVAAAAIVLGSLASPWWMVGSIVLILVMALGARRRLRN